MFQGEVQILANKPVHIAKEADREAQKLEQLQDTHDNLCDRYMVNECSKFNTHLHLREMSIDLKFD